MSEEIGDGVDGELNLQSLNEGPTLEDNTADQAAVSFRITLSRKQACSMYKSHTSNVQPWTSAIEIHNDCTCRRSWCALSHAIQLPNQSP